VGFCVCSRENDEILSATTAQVSRVDRVSRADVCMPKSHRFISNKLFVWKAAVSFLILPLKLCPTAFLYTRLSYRIGSWHAEFAFEVMIGLLSILVVKVFFLSG